MHHARAFHPTNSRAFTGLIERFLARREAVAQGSLIFRRRCPSTKGSGRNWFPHIPLPFPPYRHQEKAFDRLPARHTPQHPGGHRAPAPAKRECFLLPILEALPPAAQPGAAKGIKAIASTR